MAVRTNRLTKEQKKFLSILLSWVEDEKDYQIFKRTRDGHYLRSLLTKILTLNQYVINGSSSISSERDILNEIRNLYINEKN